MCLRWFLVIIYPPKNHHQGCVYSYELGDYVAQALLESSIANLSQRKGQTKGFWNISVNGRLQSKMHLLQTRDTCVLNPSGVFIHAREVRWSFAWSGPKVNRYIFFFFFQIGGVCVCVYYHYCKLTRSCEQSYVDDNHCYCSKMWVLWRERDVWVLQYERCKSFLSYEYCFNYHFSSVVLLHWMYYITCYTKNCH